MYSTYSNRWSLCYVKSIFLPENQLEIITNFIENYVSSLNGLTKGFNEAGLSKSNQTQVNWSLIEKQKENHKTDT